MEGVIGFVTAFAGSFAPRNWAFCQGQLMAIRSNTALFSILGTVYGGDGRVTFGLPDLRGRAVVGAGAAPGLSPYVPGDMGGAESITMTSAQMPAHVHPVQVTITPKISGTPNSASPVNAVYATGPGSLYNFSHNTPMKPFSGAIAMSPVGSNTPFSTVRPVTTLNYIICLQGVFPSRN